MSDLTDEVWKGMFVYLDPLWSNVPTVSAVLSAGGALRFLKKNQFFMFPQLVWFPFD